ncbi:glucosamine-6-phosphate deaminase [Gracilibacillus caseinilyticus]|uniref:Glucosamine-6-phosphate deaminase n=1 Tax=Gracilibacillus caseinilyticus TaxID=2932256 RepID=A0ABY4ETP7_9BACI|nr:glucosamine-6-phosphate deaminase [Gracilibacillus caseinilyticus]UOQ47644.1 glucosamine-6-phosphate deaminase [Gracilibacillus caseinilyticus]
MHIKSDKVDQLNFHLFDNREDMGKAAAKEVANKIVTLLERQETVRMIFAAAPSQIEFLQALLREKEIEWERIIAFHMDEYIGLEEAASQRFSAFLKKHIFDKVPFKKVHLIDGSKDALEECQRYAELICAEPIDIICLGIGENGHIAFNDPPVADFDDKEIMKIVELDASCRQQQVNDGCFDTFDKVPTHALTLTIPAMMSGAFLYCIVPGASKTTAVRETLTGAISTKCPATILREHPNCNMYVDRDSYGV